MNWADWSLLTLILLSTVISFFNGFVREVFSFLGWLFSFAIALWFLDELANLLKTLIPFADLRLGLSLITLFFVSFILFEWINYLLLNSIGAHTTLSLVERMVGVIFGIARGSVIVTFLIMLGGLTQLPAAAWWQQSLLIENFKPIVFVLRSQLPFEIATQFNFGPAPEQKKPRF